VSFALEKRSPMKKARRMARDFDESWVAGRYTIKRQREWKGIRQGDTTEKRWSAGEKTASG